MFTYNYEWASLIFGQHMQGGSTWWTIQILHCLYQLHLYQVPMPKSLWQVTYGHVSGTKEKVKNRFEHFFFLLNTDLIVLLLVRTWLLFFKLTHCVFNCLDVNAVTSYPSCTAPVLVTSPHGHIARMELCKSSLSVEVRAQNTLIRQLQM